MPTVVRNRLLASLLSSAGGSGLGRIERVQRHPGDILSLDHERHTVAFFPEDVVLCLLMTAEDGGTAEVGIIGPEGGIGLPGLEWPPPWVATVLTRGSICRVDLRGLKNSGPRSRALDALLHRYAEYRLYETLNLTACATFHSTAQRLCRLLLRLEDRLGPEYQMTQEQLGLVLGVRRSTITLVMRALEQDGAVEYRRGAIRILDRPATLRRSCNCYRSVQKRLERVYGETLPDAP